MKKMMISAMVLMAASAAQADGFLCSVPEYDLNVKIFNHVEPSAGTRSAAVMILSDATVQAGRKTIARFDADAGTLASSELAYEAKVDLRYSDIRRQGENVLGTKLGHLARIRADLAFTYSRPVAHGAPVRGLIRWVKRNGETGAAAMNCSRYLKNE